MKRFYVDYENVKDSGLNGVAKLTNEDVVNIYYSEDAQRMSFGTHRRIVESGAAFSYRKLSPEMKTMKNALDIIMIQDIEAVMKTDRNDYFYIVSNDDDYDEFIRKKKEKRYKIKRILEICKIDEDRLKKEKTSATKVATGTGSNKGVAANKKESKGGNTTKRKETNNKNDTAKKKNDSQKSTKLSKDEVQKIIVNKLPSYKKKKDIIVKAYLESSTRDKFNRKLQKDFSNEEVKEIRKALKQLTSEMPGK